MVLMVKEEEKKKKKLLVLDVDKLLMTTYHKQEEALLLEPRHMKLNNFYGNSFVTLLHCGCFVSWERFFIFLLFITTICYMSLKCLNLIRVIVTCLLLMS